MAKICAENSENKTAILFFTHWQEHDYIKLLSRSLLSIGYHIDYEKSLKYLFLLGFSKKKYSAIHLHWLEPFFISSNFYTSCLGALKLLVGIFIAKIRGIKIVWTVHNVKSHNGKNKLLNIFLGKAILVLSDGVIAHCKVAKKVIEKDLNNSKLSSKVVVIPHGNYNNYYIDSISRKNSRKKLGLNESDFVFLYLGMIKPYKGLDQLIKVFCEIIQSGHFPLPKLCIAGRIPDEEPLENGFEISIMSNENIIFNPGFVADEDIQVYMNASDAVVFPYKNILTSGGVVLAMSFSKACIAPKMGCITEALGDNPLVYELNAQNSLYNAMTYALSNHVSLNEIGTRNKALSDKWSWEKIAKMTSKLYLG